MSSPKSHAIALLMDPQICTTGADLAILQAKVLNQLNLIRKLEGEAAFRAIITGIGFFAVKGKLPRGKFEPWLKKNSGQGLRQCRYYMKLAAVFVEKMKASKIELRAITESGFEVSLEDGKATRLIQSMKEFIGENSLNELLIEHQIKTGGSKSSFVASDKAGGEFSIFSSIAECLYNFRTQFLKPEAVMQTPPADLRKIIEEHDAQNAELHRLCDQALGRKKG